MILYHGSNVEIFDIDLSMSKPYKDFGRAFYLSADKKQAEALAEATVARTGKGVCTISSFSFDESLMEASTLKVKTFNGYSEEWAEFILNNRNRDFKDINSEKCNFDNKYDLVIGPVADDDIIVLFRTFMDGLIDIDTLIKELTYKELTDQYSFHTSEALKYLKGVQ